MALLVTIGAAACGSSNGTDKAEKTTVRIGFQVIPNTEAIVKANKWHEDTMGKANVKWLQFDSGRDVNTALASGSIDIGLIGSTLVATGLAKGLDYQVIWLADVIGSNEALAVKKDRGIHQMSDLKGKTIAVTFGSTTQYTLLGALKTNNIDPKDVKILDMKPNDMLAAWKRGDIDGGYVWHPTLQQMIDDQGQVLVDSGKLVDKGIITADVIVVRKEFAKQHPDLVADYIKSQIKAVQLFRDNPDQAAAAVGKEFAISQAEALSMMKELIWLSGTEQASAKYLGSKQQAGDFSRVLEDTAKFLKQQGLIDNVPTSEVFQKAVAPEYLKQAMAQAEETK